MMISSQCSAQLVARLTGPAETETKTTVSHRGSASAFDQPRSSTEAELRLLKKIQLKENIASYTKPSWRDPRILAGYFRQAVNYFFVNTSNLRWTVGGLAQPPVDPARRMRTVL